jgi:acyl carrier protein
MTMNIDVGTISNELMKFVQANILAEDVVITPQTVLSDAGIDSYSIVEIILFIERKYGVVIPDELLIPENFRTISLLAATTQKLL